MNVAHFLAASAFAASMCAQAAPTLITSSADPSLSGSSLIDFESAAQGTFPSTTISGVTFSAAPGSLYIESIYSGQYAATGQYLANRETPEPVTISFGTAVSAFGFNWGAADQPWTLELFDGSNNLLGTLNIAAQTDPYASFIGAASSSADIASVKLTALSSYGYDYFLLDNFQFVSGGSQVPEPGTLLLLGLAAAGFGAASRRKKA